MTFKINFNGGTLEESKEALDRQMKQHIDNKNMSEESSAAIKKIVDAMPGTHLSGMIQDNNNGSMTIQLVARTQAKVETVSSRGSSRAGATGSGTAARPMESARANAGGEQGNRSTTGSPTGGAQDAKALSQAAAAEAKPNDAKK